MRRRPTRQDQTGMQLDMFRDIRPSGANLTDEIFRRDVVIDTRHGVDEPAARAKAKREPYRATTYYRR